MDYNIVQLSHSKFACAALFARLEQDQLQINFKLVRKDGAVGTSNLLFNH